MQKRVILTNVDADGVAVCIKANYYKMSAKNLAPQIRGGRFAAPGVIEVYEESNSDEPNA